MWPVDNVSVSTPCFEAPNFEMIRVYRRSLLKKFCLFKNKNIWYLKSWYSIAGPSNKGFTATLPMTTADMLSALTTAPLEYSYFDQGKLGAWAGPKHWKFKPLSRPNPDGEKTKGRKKKVIPLSVDQ